MIWRTVARVSGSNARATVSSSSRISAVSTLVASFSSSSFSLSFSVSVIKKLDDVFVRSIAQSAQERGGKKLPAPLASVEINVKEIGRIKLDLNPGSPIRNDPEAVKDLAVYVDSRFKSNPRRAMQLAYHYTLCAVYNESPLGRHQGDFTHIDFLFLRAFFFAQLERDMQRRAVGLSFPLRLQGA